MPTVAKSMDLVAIAKACGYPKTACVDNFEDLDKILATAKKANSLFFIEIKCSIGARDDLGRPTTTALENKIAFMNHLKTILESILHYERLKHKDIPIQRFDDSPNDPHLFGLRSNQPFSGFPRL